MNNNIKISISSTFDCLVCAQNDALLKANVSTLEVECQKNDHFFVYPLGEGISYVVNIVDGEIEKRREIEIVKYFDNEYEIILKPYLILGFPSKIENQKIGEYTLSLILSKPSLFCVKKADTYDFCKIDEHFDSFEFLSFDNMPAILLKKNILQEMIIYQEGNQEFLKLKGEINIENGTLTVVSPLCDTSHRAKVMVYVQENLKLKKQSEELIYLDGRPVYPKQSALIPFAFFEAIKCKDYFFARTFLSDDLQKDIDENILEDYFGQFDKIKPYNYNRDKGYFVAISGKDKCQVYRLLVEKDKIVEIEKLLKHNGIDRYE